MTVRYTEAEAFAIEMNQRRKIGQKALPNSEPGVERESKLHQDIIEWCNSQWPRWKYVHARMDKKSGLDKGVADFVLFGPKKQCFVIECKKSDGKISPDQRGWIAEMAMIQWPVLIVRSYEEFLEIVKI
jgi:VRR-NUC domain